MRNPERLIEEAQRLIAGWRVSEALIHLTREVPDDNVDPRLLGLLRQCFARSGQFEAAALVGRRLIASGGAGREDLLRQAQILNQCQRYEEAFALSAQLLRQTPGADDALRAAVEAVLAKPTLSADLFALYSLETGVHAERMAERPSTLDVFTSIKCPYMKNFEVGHPAAMGLFNNSGVPLSMPEVDPERDSFWLQGAFSQALAVVDALLNAHSVIDRPAAAAFVAARFVAYRGTAETAITHFVRPWMMSLFERPFVYWMDQLAQLFLPVHPMESMRINTGSAHYWIIRALLESPWCISIMTQFGPSRGGLTRLFPSKVIAEKMVTVAPWDPPMAPDRARRANGGSSGGQRPITFLFASSLATWGGSAHTRGIVDVLLAFRDLSREFPNVRLVLRSVIPSHVSEELRELARSHPGIIWRPDRIDPDEYESLLQSCDVQLLPTPMLYRNALIDAMRMGIVPIVSDFIGVEDFVKDGETGYIIHDTRDYIGIDQAPLGFHQELLPLLSACDQPPDREYHQRFLGRLRELCANPKLIDVVRERLLGGHPFIEHGPANQELFDSTLDKAISTSQRLLSQSSRIELGVAPN